MFSKLGLPLMILLFTVHCSHIVEIDIIAGVEVLSHVDVIDATQVINRAREICVSKSVCDLLFCIRWNWDKLQLAPDFPSELTGPEVDH